MPNPTKFQRFTNLKIFLCIFATILNISGPDLPKPLVLHSMVALGNGQAILGGKDDDNVVQSKIYHMKCSQNVWDVITLEKELSIPRTRFLAIPIPDHLSRCISESRLRFYL